ncbi:3-deoxy-manno-octulosonate cytidylyltransferase [Bacteroidia bacterium]|nr:3-deoxy-manno-octulosonate cytidylyltransferase [Bacteroidia bacterium]
MNVVAVIPARYKSSRFPGKPLVEIDGVPLIIRVARITATALGLDSVFVATDDDRIATCCTDHGFQVLMTSSDCLTGTDRLVEASLQLDYDIMVNVQGDEPLLNPQDILDVIEVKKNNMDWVVNAMATIGPDENSENKNIPKVIANESNHLVYMSRSVIPGNKNGIQTKYPYKKQVCIYAFTKKELAAYGSFGRKSKIESMEDIEILRFLELNIPVLMHEVKGSSLAVDVPEDVALVEAKLKGI